MVHWEYDGNEITLSENNKDFDTRFLSVYIYEDRVYIADIQKGFIPEYDRHFLRLISPEKAIEVFEEAISFIKENQSPNAVEK